MSRVRRVLYAGLLSSLLAGCGAPAPTVSEPPLPPEPVRAPVSQPPGSEGAVRDILARVSQAREATRTWTALAKSTVIAPDGSRDYNVSQMAFQRPGLTAATIMDAAVGKKTGTKLIYDGRDKVAIKTNFFGFIPLRITLPVDDSRLLDAYNRSIRDGSTERFMAAILHPQARVTRVGTARMAGEQVELLEIRSPASWKGISREVVGIAHRLNLPITRDCYDMANKRVFHLELEGMRVNGPLPKDAFKLD